MPLLTILFRLALGVLAGLAALMWIRQTLAPSRARATGAALLAGGSAFLGLAGLEFLPTAPVQLRITGVASGQPVAGAAVVLTGTVTPPDARVTIWVHPLDSDRWWLQPPPRVTSRGSGAARWSGTIHLGDSLRGGGESFQVVAQGSRAPLAWDILAGRSYRTGDEIRRLPPLSQSRPVLLRRAP